MHPMPFFRKLLDVGLPEDSVSVKIKGSAGRLKLRYTVVFLRLEKGTPKRVNNEL